MSQSKHAKEAQILPIAETFGSEFQVLVDGADVGHVTWRQLVELTERQLAQIAPSSIALKGNTALAVYEARTHAGSSGSSDALRLEIGPETLELSAAAARNLARVLLAYAESNNLRHQWLVRREFFQAK